MRNLEFESSKLSNGHLTIYSGKLANLQPGAETKSNTVYEGPQHFLLRETYILQ